MRQNPAFFLYILLAVSGCGASTGDGPAIPDPVASNYAGDANVEGGTKTPASNNSEAIGSQESSLPRVDPDDTSNLPTLPKEEPRSQNPTPDPVVEETPPVPNPDPVPETPVEEEEPAPEPIPGPDVIPEDETPEPPPEVISTPDQPVEPSTAQFTAMLDSGKVVTRYDITNASSWGTNRNKRIEVFVAVDGAGRPLVPAVRETQIDGRRNNRNDERFVDRNGDPIRSLHSVLKICNRSGKTLSLKTLVDQPLPNGRKNLGNNDCSQFLIQNANSFIDNTTFDGSVLNPIFFKLTKIDLNGRKVP